MLSKDLESTLNAAFTVARSKRHEFMTVEHLLLALLDNDSASRLLYACGANMNHLRIELPYCINSTGFSARYPARSLPCAIIRQV